MVVYSLQYSSVDKLKNIALVIMNNCDIIRRNSSFCWVMLKSELYKLL